MSAEVVADLPTEFLQAIREGPVADEAAECGGTVVAGILKCDGKKDGQQRPRALRIDGDLSLAGLVDLFEGVLTTKQRLDRALNALR